MAKKNSNAVLNIKKRWFRRTYISTTEFISGLVSIAVIAVSGLWFFWQKDRFDPQERDLDPSLLADQNTLELYTPPLKLWQEPGAEPTTAGAPNIAPFPSSIVDEQWQPAGRIKSFEPDNLFEKINGEAEKFLKQNFQKLYYLVLKSTRDATEISIELFDHKDIPSSIGIFSGHISGDNELLNEGQVSYFKTGAGMIGRKGRYFFRVAATDLNDSVEQKVTQLARVFGDLEEKADELPMEYRVLSENLNIPGNAISYTAENVFQYDFAKNFWFGTLPTSGDGEAQAFIHVDESASNSEMLYQLLLTELEFDYEVVETFENTAILKHRFLDTYFVVQHKGPYLFGVDKLSDREKVPAVMSALLKGINEKSG